MKLGKAVCGEWDPDPDSTYIDYISQGLGFGYTFSELCKFLEISDLKGELPASVA